ncbi:MAG: hypothetical protein ACTHN4_08260 [Sphingomicrobium sp.]
MKLWSYKISRDYGFAPNPYFGFCTIACCKPDIRRGAVVGDLIVGCGSSKLQLGGHVIYAMRVTEKLTFQQYWDDPRFERKRPSFSAGTARSYGDNIYHHDAQGRWIQEDSHHSLDDGGWNQLNAERDLGADAVLVSADFVYWGRLAPEIPVQLRNFDGDDLYPNVRNLRNSYSEIFKNAAVDWFDGQDKGRFGRPINWRD